MIRINVLHWALSQKLEERRQPWSVCRLLMPKKLDGEKFWYRISFQVKRVGWKSLKMTGHELSFM